MTVIENIVKNINEAFDVDKTFFKNDALPKDFVEAHITYGGGLFLRIGWRDVQLRADGTWVDEGTDVELLEKYTIK